MDDLKFQKIIELFRKQLEWDVKKGEGLYEHAKKVYEEPRNGAKEMSPEDFVAQYRLNFKPKYPDHPTGGVIADGHYGEDGDFIFITES